MNTPIDLETYTDTVAAAVGIELDPTHRRQVIDNLKVIFAHAGLVMDFALEDTIEPAPAFRV